jgi:hypothetical protein
MTSVTPVTPPARWDYCARCRAWIELRPTAHGDLCAGCRRTVRAIVDDDFVMVTMSDSPQ